MGKPTTNYVCQSCGASNSKWTGRCEACNGWNTLAEEFIEAPIPKGLGNKSIGRPSSILFKDLLSETEHPPRRLSNINEFDRVLGGGLVQGSATLLGGDPGIGKSTLVLQVVHRLAESNRVVYVSGEESIDQIRLRASRLGLTNNRCQLACATSVREIIASIDHHDAPAVLIIDSIQTMFIDTMESAPGTVAQVRASAQELIRIAKKRGISLLLIGHVTKEGTIAGPRVLEHMVDTVLYLEGDRGHQFRILRGVKNRYGATNEIGIFEMTDQGLVEVQNPSALFLADRHGDTSGATVFAGLEGTRPVLVEIQALVVPASFGTPRRQVIGWDQGRLSMVMAVLEARCGIAFGNSDVYLNVAGGLRISEPAADLAVAMALLSSLTGKAVPSELVVIGEIGLSGEIRRVSQPDIRLKEALKLGFSQAITPKNEHKSAAAITPTLKNTQIRHLSEILPMFQEAQKLRSA